MNWHDDGYVADFFAGSGGVSRAVRKLGFKTRDWEIEKGAAYDLTKPSVIRKILDDIRRGKIIAAMFAPPCSSFSRARDRTRVIRTKDYPFGLPGLPEHERLKVLTGNKCFASAVQIIKELNKYGIPWILENPHSSKCWYLPALIKMASLDNVHIRVTDFCCHGTRWRKRTQFLVGNVDLLDSQRLQVLCSGTSGLCSRTQRKHFQLTGSGPKGIPWTRIAQPYPRRLCHHLAHVLLASKLLIPNY